MMRHETRAEMMWHDFERNKQTAEMCAWNILSRMIFKICFSKKLLTQSCNQADIFWKFNSPADTLWLPKTIKWVFGYITVPIFFLFFPIFSKFVWLKWSTAPNLTPKITENIVYRDIDSKHIIWETTLFWKLFL